MALRPGDGRAFWRPGPEAAEVLAERRMWLSRNPAGYTALLPEGDGMAREALELLAAWSGADPVAAAPVEPPALALPRSGTLLEPDWIILSGEAESEPRVLGGVVIFPSSWSLPEKLGRPLREVHGPVPGLEAELGRSIGTFLDRLEAGAAWERDNWGLSADAELNHHPARSLPALASNATLVATWLRLERQFLTRLPASGGVLFGIRVNVYRLDHLAALPGVAHRLAQALETMTDATSDYKGLRQARLALSAQLRRLPVG